jgi:hypothetical protein
MSIKEYFNFTPSSDQLKALENIEDFLNSDSSIFILKGYAGTGKTTLIKCIADYLTDNKINFHLMAPTGRAARVMSEKTGIEAATIHRIIYSYSDLIEYEVKETDETPTYKYYYKLKSTSEIVNDIYIADEASMISDIESEAEFFRFGSGYLLRDLMSFTRVGVAGNRSKIIFIGDPAQLPPIGMNMTPAIDEAYIYKNYGITPVISELRQVLRQGDDNTLLNKATSLRLAIGKGIFNSFNLSPDNKSTFSVPSEFFLEHFLKNEGNKIIITYKNKTALQVNKQIRNCLFEFSSYPQVGDHIIVGHNNYSFSIFNGEFGIVIIANEEPISRTVPVWDNKKRTNVTLTWRYIEILFNNLEKSSKIVKGYMLENYLASDNSSLPSIEAKALYIDFKIRNPQLKPHTEEFKDSIKNDLFFHSLMIKYGYAVTCHKAQGGEWDHVYTIWDYSTKDGNDVFNGLQKKTGRTNIDFYRWSYTAITRAKKFLYNINPPKFSPYSEMTFVPNKSLEELYRITGEKPSIVKIDFNDMLIDKIKNIGLESAHEFKIIKFIELQYLLSSRYINIIKHESKPYQEFYTFERDGKITNIVFYYNSKNQFTKNQIVKSANNDLLLLQEITSALKHNIRLEIDFESSDNNSEESSKEEVFYFESEFQKDHFSILNNLCKGKGIRISEITHLPFRERYSFNSGSKDAVFDFVFNGDWFFTSVEERNNLPSDLLIDIYGIITKLKSQE